MFIPESMKKDALRRVRQEIETEIKKNLTIDIDGHYDDDPYSLNTISINVKLKYKDEEISSSSINI